MPSVHDVNDPAQLPGIGVFPATLDASRHRMTTSTAYLTDSVRSRPNLVVRTAAPVSKLLIADGRAVGVTLDDGEEVRADEVVVAAGAIGSPTLLLRSGTGPREQLASRGIEIHADLPVGSIMSDHLGTALTYQCDRPSIGIGGPAQTVLIGASNSKDVDHHVFPTPSLDPGAPWSSAIRPVRRRSPRHRCRTMLTFDWDMRSAGSRHGRTRLRRGPSDAGQSTRTT